MAKQERSAGIIVFRPAPDAAGGGDDRASRLYLLLDYGRHWDYAKGHVEPGEDDRAAARRELREETGIDDFAFVEGFAHEIIYYFRARKHLVRKTVAFFLGQTPRADVRLSHEHAAHAWLPYDEALARLTFATAREVLRRAHKFLDASPGNPAPLDP